MRVKSTSYWGGNGTAPNPTESLDDERLGVLPRRGTERKQDRRLAGRELFPQRRTSPDTSLPPSLVFSTYKIGLQQSGHVNPLKAADSAPFRSPSLAAPFRRA